MSLWFASVPTIGELRNHLRSNGWGVRVPRSTSIEHDSIEVKGVADPADAAALDRLAPDQRQLIEYRHGVGMTQSEIGRLIGISQPQVHRRLAAAEAALRRELEGGNE